MNKDRRKKIAETIDKLRQCSGNLYDIKNEEDDSRENIPENLQSSEFYCYSEECSDNIDEAISEIDSAISSLEDI